MRQSTVLLALLGLGGALLAVACGDDAPSRPTAGPAAPHVQEPPGGPAVTIEAPSALEIERDYDQLVRIGVRNAGPGPARLRLLAEAPEDLPTGFVGHGSGPSVGADRAIRIPAGETWQVPLLVHADHAEGSSYRVVLTAHALDAGVPLATTTLEVRVRSPELRLETTWSDPPDLLSRARLLKRLTLRNAGAAVGDLSVAFAPAEGSHAASVRFHPLVERARLPKGAELVVDVAPRLHPSFEAVGGEIVLTGLGRELRLPYRAEVPDQKRVFVTLSRCSFWDRVNGTRCTNCEKVGYEAAPVPGTPAEPGGHRDPGASTADEEDDEGYGWSAGDEEDHPYVDRPDLLDEGVFDHADANTEGTESGEIPPESTGPPDRPPVRVDRPLGEGPDDTRGARAPSTRETSTYVDDDGRRTHMVRRRRPKGDHLNFSFGIQPGRRLNVPVSLGHRARDPSLGPAPDREAGGGGVAYVRDLEDGTRTIEILDPRTGKRQTLTDPSGSAESPRMVRVGDHVEVFYRQDGELKRARIVGDLESLEPVNWPPPGTEVGRLLEAVVDPDGRPLVLTREDGHVALSGPGGRETHRGLHGDVVFTKGGERVLAVLRPDGAIDALGPEGRVTNLVPASPSNGPPALLRTNTGGARLFFHRRLPAHEEGAAPGEVGLDLGGNFAVDYDGQWTAPRRVFLPEMPVDVAAVMLTMNMPYGNAHYSPMDMRIELNGHEIGRIEDKIPQGRYLYRVPPSLLRYASATATGPIAGNRVELLISGIGRGHFHITESCGIYAHGRLLQGCLVAETADEAERLAQESTPTIRHDAPDLVVTSNGFELPRDLGPGVEIPMRVGVFNGGDRIVPAGVLHWSVGGDVRGETPHGALQPFTGTVLRFVARLPDTWTRGADLRLSVRAPVADDADPTTNRLDFVLLKELAPEVSGPTGPAAVDLGALPEEAIQAVEIPADGHYRGALRHDRLWYRMAVEPGRTLLVDVDGPGADRVERLDLFDPDGQPVRATGDHYETGADTLYLRVGVAGDGPIPNETTIQLAWQ